MVYRLMEGVEIREALRRLAARLARRGVVGDICVYGGAAMVLAFDARRATRDVDAIFMPHGMILEEAQAVAREMSIGEGWLNDSVSVCVSRTADSGQPSIYDHPNLRVRSVSALHLVAMKARAARGFASDKDDLVVLVRRLGLRTAEEVEAICAEVFPDAPLSDHSRRAVEEAVAIAVGEGEGAAVEQVVWQLRAATHGVGAPGDKPRCGHWIESAGAPCLLKPLHRGHHRSRT